MSFVLHNCTSLFVLPVSLNKISKAQEKPSTSKGNMLYVIPIVPPACVFAPWIHSVVTYKETSFYDNGFMPRKRQRIVVVAACFTLTARDFLLLQSTNLLCLFARREWSTKLRDSVWPNQSPQSAVIIKVTKTWIPPVQLIKSDYYFKI